MANINTKYAVHVLNYDNVWILSRVRGSDSIPGSRVDQLGWFCTKCNYNDKSCYCSTNDNLVTTR